MLLQVGVVHSCIADECLLKTRLLSGGILVRVWSAPASGGVTVVVGCAGRLEHSDSGRQRADQDALHPGLLPRTTTHEAWLRHETGHELALLALLGAFP